MRCMHMQLHGGVLHAYAVALASVLHAYVVAWASDAYAVAWASVLHACGLQVYAYAVKPGSNVTFANS